MLNVSANYQTLLVIALTGFASGILVVVFMGHRYQKILCAMRKTYHLMHGQEQRNETIVEALPVGLEIYNTDGSLRRRNRRICEILGEPADCKGTLLTNPPVSEEIQRRVSLQGIYSGRFHLPAAP